MTVLGFQVAKEGPMLFLYDSEYVSGFSLEYKSDYQSHN